MKGLINAQVFLFLFLYSFIKRVTLAIWRYFNNSLTLLFLNQIIYNLNPFFHLQNYKPLIYPILHNNNNELTFTILLHNCAKGGRTLRKALVHNIPVYPKQSLRHSSNVLKLVTFQRHAETRHSFATRITRDACAIIVQQGKPCVCPFEERIFVPARVQTKIRKCNRVCQPRFNPTTSKKGSCRGI